MTPDELHHRLTDEPEIVNTINGEMSKHDLVRKVVKFEDDNELTYAIEYRLKGDNDDAKPVHRSVHVQLKKNVTSEAVAAMLNA